MKRLIFVILIILIGVLGIGFLMKHSEGHRPAHDALGAIADGGDYLLTKDTETYSFSVRYPLRPVPAGDAAANELALKTIQAWVASTTAEFAHISDELSPAERTHFGESGRKYELDVGYHPYSSPASASYEFDIYMDTGGAHPNTSFKTFVFDTSGNAVPLATLFAPGSDYLKFISEKALASVRADLTERLGKDVSGVLFEEGLAPDQKNFGQFVIDGDSIIFFIPPYQVAPYAAGTFAVKIPLSEFGTMAGGGM